MPGSAVVMVPGAHPVAADDSSLTPGLTVIALNGEETADDIAARLGARVLTSYTQARRELKATLRTAALSPEAARARADGARLRLAMAESSVEEAMRHVPAGLLVAEPEHVRLTALTAQAAEEHLREAYTALGPRPGFDPEAEADAHAAQQAMEAASASRRAGLHHSYLLLNVANTLGLAIVGARLLDPTIDPLVPWVGVLPGSVAAIALARLGRSTARKALARRSLADALTRVGVTTMSGLVARRQRLDAWTARTAGIAGIEEAYDDALGRWQALAGPEADPDQGEALLSRVDRMHDAESELGEALAAVVDAEGAAAEAAAAPPLVALVVADFLGDLSATSRSRLLTDLERAASAVPVVVVTGDLAAHPLAQAETDGPGDDAGTANGDELPAPLLRERFLAALRSLA